MTTDTEELLAFLDRQIDRALAGPRGRYRPDKSGDQGHQGQTGRD